jgi:phospholipid/cholesterol/gamma-HCH transport system substrate-binding protein
MKAFTDRNPRVIGAIAVMVAVAIVAGVLLLNRSFFSPTYTVKARFSNAAGIGKGATVMVAGVNAGTVSGVEIDGNDVLVDMAINHGVVLPQQTSAGIEVETVLGVLDVTLDPQTGWQHPLHNGSLITRTSIPVEFQDLENTTGNLIQNSDIAAFNQLLESVEAVSQNKQGEVASIISGLDKFTGVISQRQAQVSSLIDSANTVASAVAQKDQQLGSLVDDLSTVVQGLAQRSGELSALITNTESVAAQTSSLIGQNQPELQGLIGHLTSVLAVLQQHQDDLAQAVSYLDSAITGFASIGVSGPNNTPNPSWANQYVNLIGLAGGYNVLGNCGAMDQALDEILGPDPLPCDQRTGPPVTDNSATPSGGPGPVSSDGGSSGSSSPSGSSSTGSSSGSSAASGSSSAAGVGGSSSSVTNPIEKVLSPLLGDKG